MKIKCNNCGVVDIPITEEIKQLCKPDIFWYCPICKSEDIILLEETEK